MNKQYTEGLYSWPAIIVLLFLFWPVGLYLMYKRAQHDKKTAFTAAKLLNLLGTILIVVGIVLLIAVVGIFYLIAGIVLKKIAKKLRNSSENVKRYLTIVVNGNVRQLDAISAAISKPYETVKSDLQKMIDDGYFKNAYIKEDTREIVLTQSQPVQTEGYAFSGTATTSVRVVACPCCGANNTVSGDLGECEYCGSPLS